MYLYTCPRVHAVPIREKELHGDRHESTCHVYMFAKSDTFHAARGAIWRGALTQTGVVCYKDKGGEAGNTAKEASRRASRLVSCACCVLRCRAAHAYAESPTPQIARMLKCLAGRASPLMDKRLL